jgi:ATP-dependent helicase/nuclease subunit B
MLQIVPCTSLADKEAHLLSAPLAEISWIVSDLQSKRELQKRLHQRLPFVEELHVLRASELWRKMFLQLDPDMHLISNELTQVLLREWLGHFDLPWARSPQSQKALLVYLEQFLPFLVHDHGEDLLLHWLEEHPQAQMRWRSWFELSKHAWRFLFEHKQMPLPLAGPALLCYDLAKLRWPKQFVFDLGSAIAPLEVELIATLAATNTVTVLRPVGSWTEGFLAVTSSYQRLAPSP